MKNLIIALIFVVLTACSKENVYLQSCIEYEDVSDVSFNSKYIVIYYKYDVLNVNEAYKYGIGDSTLIITSSSISDVVNTKNDLKQVLNQITCNNYEYINEYHLTFENYIPNSRRFEIFESNSSGKMKNSEPTIIKIIK